MSIELDWETITSGPDGEALATRIRDFVHDKFQAVKLPRFIKSVTVHDFEFGSVSPDLELKDITDPLPDFYEEDEDYDYDDEEDGDAEAEDGDGISRDGGASELRGGGAGMPGRRRQQEQMRDAAAAAGLPSRLQAASLAGRSGSPLRSGPPAGDLTSPFLGVSTPGILGGTSNLHYFQNHMGAGWSGTQTPLAAVAGAQMGGSGGGAGYSWADSSAASSPGLPPQHRHPSEAEGMFGTAYDSPGHSRNPSQSSISLGDFNPALASLMPNAPSSAPPGTPQIPGQLLREKHSVSTLAPTSVNTSRPPTRDPSNLAAAAAAAAAAASAGSSSAIREDDQGHEWHRHKARGSRELHDDNDDDECTQEEHQREQRQQRFREPRPEDIQAVFRIRYAGDIKLRLTAEILLDYPMPSFVGIPVQLSVTGLTFDGVGVLAHIRKRVHFCFLSPEDAVTAVGLPEAEVGGHDVHGDEDEEVSRRPHERQWQGHGQGDGESGGQEGRGERTRRFGGLLQEIRVESEIGLREGGKQSLKNVGKVERFVLEQVRRIFEDEFVYPSFWTFLV